MTSAIHYSRYSITALLAILALFSVLTACDSSDNKKETARTEAEIITLNDANSNKFSQQFIRDYNAIQGSLLTEFNNFKTAKDSYGFTKYRNHTWTPLYIEKKSYYQSVLKKNRDYIETSTLKPLFLSFENLIYIGINLKNGLLDNNQTLIDDTLKEADNDQKTMASILKNL